MIPRILIVEDEAESRLLLKRILKDMGVIGEAVNALEASEMIKTGSWDLVVSDLRLGESSGWDVLKSNAGRIPVILVTGFATVETAVKAIQEGAYDFIEKPIKPDRLTAIARNALRLRLLEEENNALKIGSSEFVTSDPATLKALALAVQFADSDLPVLITGETGTGKELVARLVHDKSPRSGKKMFAVNCGAIPANLLESELFGHSKGSFTGAHIDRKGLFEAADGSTLFLDEISAMPMDIQSKLLRSLQEGTIRKVGSNEEMPVDVRVVSASADDPDIAMKEGRFRPDLYYRLSAARIRIPPLRKRRDDIPLLVCHFLDVFFHRTERRLTVAPRVMDIFSSFDWPGNVRELKNMVERAAVVCRTSEIGISDLPDHIMDSVKNAIPFTNGDADYKQELQALTDNFDRKSIQEALKKCGGRMGEAAERMGISLRNLQYKIKRLGLKAEESLLASSESGSLPDQPEPLPDSSETTPDS